MLAIWDGVTLGTLAKDERIFTPGRNERWSFLNDRVLAVCIWTESDELPEGLSLLVKTALRAGVDGRGLPFLQNRVPFDCIVVNSNFSAYHWNVRFGHNGAQQRFFTYDQDYVGLGVSTDWLSKTRIPTRDSLMMFGSHATWERGEVLQTWAPAVITETLKGPG